MYLCNVAQQLKMKVSKTMSILNYYVDKTDADYDARVQLFSAKRTALLMLASIAINGKELQSQALNAFIVEIASNHNTLAEFELERADYDTPKATEALAAFYTAAWYLADTLIEADNEAS